MTTSPNGHRPGAAAPEKRISPRFAEEAIERKEFADKLCREAFVLAVAMRGQQRPKPFAAPEDQQDDTKRLATLQARGALRGITIHSLANGNFLCCRWGLSRELDTLARVEAWLDSVLGAKQ